jgi:hypothetical protein
MLSFRVAHRTPEQQARDEYASVDVRELRYVLETADRMQPHPGEKLLAELTAARLVVHMARRGFGTSADMARHAAFDPVALQGAIVAYDAARKEAGE